MSLPPPSPEDDHRRQLRRFARWFTAVHDAGETYHAAILMLARTIDLGGMTTLDTHAALDALDGLLAEVWDRRPKDDPAASCSPSPHTR